MQARAELDCSLKTIHLVSLDKPLDLAPNPLDQICSPMVGTGTVLLHGNKAPFADIIAPFTFIQAKFNNRSSSILKVDLSLELRKCSLLKEPDVDTRVLQGFVAMWRGITTPVSWTHTPALDSDASQQSTPPTTLQHSAAFPENLLRLVAKSNPVKYAVIQGDYITTDGDNECPLPHLEETTLNFILATNVNIIQLVLSRDEEITIDETNLDDDLGIEISSLTDNDTRAWTEFDERVPEGIQIRFLLTRSA